MCVDMRGVGPGIEKLPHHVGVEERGRVFQGRLLKTVERVDLRIVREQCCDRSDKCGARTVWETIHERVIEALDGMTLADL